MDWIATINWADKILSDFAIYFFSSLGFVLLPAHFGRKVWWLVFWFFVINVFFLLGFWEAVDWRKPLLFIALGIFPWLLFVLDLLFKGRLGPKVAQVPMREYLLWQVTRLMGIHLALAIYGRHAPLEFALEMGFSEGVTGMGALILYALYRPERGWYRTLLIFWNTYGLTSALAAEYRMVLSNPYLPFARFPRDIFQYITAYPQSWEYCFWLPIAIGMHAAIFYKMYLARAPQSVYLQMNAQKESHAK